MRIELSIFMCHRIHDFEGALSCKFDLCDHPLVVHLLSLFSAAMNRIGNNIVKHKSRKPPCIVAWSHAHLRFSILTNRFYFCFLNGNRVFNSLTLRIHVKTRFVNEKQPNDVLHVIRSLSES